MPSTEKHCLVPGRFLFLVSIFLFFLALSVPLAVYADQAVVKEAVVNLRSAPTTESIIVGKAAQGERLEVLSKQGDWYRVKKNGAESWVAGWLVEVSRSPAAIPYGAGGQVSRDAPAAAPSAEKNAVRAEVTEDGVNIRSGPGTGFSILGRAGAGSQYDIADKSGGWYKISGGNISGWISDQFVKISAAAASRGAVDRPSPVSGLAVVKGSGVNIRSGPGTNYNVVSSANQGQSFSLVEKTNDWYKVRLDNNSTGWVVAWLVDVDRPKSPVNEGGSGIIPPPPAKEPEKGGVAKPPAQEQKKENGRIRSVTARAEGDATVVTVVSDGKPMKYSVTTALDPDRIVIDINDFEPGSAPEKISFSSRLVKGVRVGLNSGSPAVTRVVVDLGAVTRCEKAISSDGTQLTVKIMPRLEKSLSGAKIVLDPGHGGSEPGAIGPAGLKEKTVNLDIAQKTAEILKKQGATVVLTRTGDVYMDLNSRPEVANKMGADLFVSIHSNASTSNKADGTSTYYPRSDSGGMDLVRLEGAYLSRAIQKNLLGALKRDDLGVLQADFVVIVKSRVPAALVEVAFVSNPQEEKLLADDSFRSKAAVAIAQGIADYLKLR